jgi:hypothetical protein
LHYVFEEAFLAADQGTLFLVVVDAVLVNPGAVAALAPPLAPGVAAGGTLVFLLRAVLLIGGGTVGFAALGAAGAPDGGVETTAAENTDGYFEDGDVCGLRRRGMLVRRRLV